ncbi:alpha/beta fold hydrolase [Pseudonocardia eucalypti]|uniref:Alpha/beta fold hydrolase n=1 Tax=Pseudonocardia eucalypti TaxID=648755 RepID=A0ABP9RBS1_9PSEU|nr:pimeloyl-ACP methyl ester carboxylesterase [Pseudonocardia eucalypti]
MTVVEVEPGVRLHVRDVGRGRPVLLIAGFGLDHEVWHAQLRDLAPSYRVLGLDLRGTGSSDKPVRGYGMDRLVADVRTVLDRLDLRDVSLVGYSFGGQVGLAVAAAGERRLAQLVLVCSNGVRATRSARFPFGRDADRLEPALLTAERTDRKAARRANVRGAFGTVPEPGLVDWLVGMQLRMPTWSAIECYRTYLRTDLTAALDGVGLPVRQIVGAADPVTPADGAEWVRRRLAASGGDGHLTVLAECGHYPMFEAGERFDRALAGYLAEVG